MLRLNTLFSNFFAQNIAFTICPIIVLSKAKNLHNLKEFVSKDTRCVGGD